MMLPKDTVEQFIRVYKAEYGVDLEYDKADIMAQELINLMKLVYTQENSELDGGVTRPIR